MAMRAAMAAGLFLLLAADLPAFAQTSTMGSDTLLNQLSDISQLPLLSSAVASLDSSYDRTGGNADFGNYVSTNGATAVMADLKGPGAVVRIWSANPQGSLKIYIDDNPVPMVNQPFAKLFDNSTPPFQNPISGMSSGGFVCYFPMTFAKHCVITTDSSPTLYYQVTSVKFPIDTKIRPFALPITMADAAALDLANGAWWGEASRPPQASLTADQSVMSGKTIALGTYSGPASIQQIRLLLPDVANADLRKLVLRIFFDNHSAPDIEAPVADFFGNAYGRKPFRSLLLRQETDGTFAASFPMPFGKSACCTLENGLSRTIRVGWSADIRQEQFNPATEGYFHAQWNSGETVAGFPHIWAHVIGQRGKLVGIVQTMNGSGGLGFLEGDDQVRVDDQQWKKPPQTPSTVIGPWNGTGTEDCFNSGWYFSGGDNDLPMNGVLERLDTGQIDCYRWFLNDAPIFQSSLDAQIEHGGENDSPNVYYSSVAYWYSDGPATALTVFPKASELPVPIPPRPYFVLPNAIEGETMISSETGGSVSPQYMLSFGKVWSDNAQLFWHGGKLGDSLLLTINPPHPGRFDLVGYFTKASDYAQVKFEINGKLIGPVLDSYSNGVMATGPIDLGVVTLPQTPSTLKITIVGQNSRSANTYFGIDAVCLNTPGSAPFPLPAN